MTCEHELQQLVQEVGRSFLDIGHKLMECRRTLWYKLLGFDTLDEFVERRLQMSSRTGRYLVRVYEFYVVQNEFPVERLIQIGWTKLEKLLPVLEHKPGAAHVQEWMRWFAYAAGHTVRELEVRVLAHLSPEEKERHGLRAAYTVPVTEGQREVLNQALEIVKKQTGSKDPGTAWEYLAADFLSGATQEETEGTPTIVRSFRLTPEQDKTVQRALFVIRWTVTESDVASLVHLCEFFLKRWSDSGAADRRVALKVRHYDKDKNRTI